MFVHRASKFLFGTIERQHFFTNVPGVEHYSYYSNPIKFEVSFIKMFQMWIFLEEIIIVKNFDFNCSGTLRRAMIQSAKFR